MDRLSKEQLEDCGRLFALFDKNSDNRLSSQELGSALRSLGVNISEEEVRRERDTVDRNRNGSLEFNEFCELYERYLRNLLSPERLLSTLAAFDRNNTGMLDPVELKQILTTQGEPLTASEVDDIFREAGVGSGPIDYKVLATALSRRF